MTPASNESSKEHPDAPLDALSGGGGGGDSPPASAAPESADRDPAWAAFEGQLERVAAGSDATVLLTGESGSGKSVAARRIHDRSDRSGGPFVSVHLAGLASTLLEAELFGHVAGAFTGAQGEREGRFQRANGGTLVLEAIETLEYALQVKLLRVLQERVVEPLGAESSVPVDVRVIATTAHDLRRAIEDGAFREDLYYRLAVVPLSVPPLRSRLAEGDSRALLERVARAVAERIGVPPRELTDSACSALAAHPWPGNFRELENAFERILVLGPAERPIEGKELAFLSEGLAGRAEEIAAEALASGVTLDALDAAMIEEALRQERGNLSAAARRVGLSRRALDYRRKKLHSSGAEAPGD